MIVATKTYKEPDFCEKEILRYAGCKKEDDAVLKLMHSCIDEVREKLAYKVCWCNLPVTVCDSMCDFGCFKLSSKDLAKNLSKAESAVIFGATVGVELDRLITKYGKTSPARALMLGAIGTERIEALCDIFCRDFEREKQVHLGLRFSPGYGDLALDTQKQIFNILDLGKRIGLFLNSSMIMSPSKSVTAFVGIGEETEKTNKCEKCESRDCIYRGVL